MSQRSSALTRPTSSKRRLKDLLLQKDNRVCADCGSPDPKWASTNIGVFICLKCCGVHRSLGTHISKVLSVTLDEWSDDEIDAMVEVGGNASANSIYEAYIPEGISKPGPDASHEQRSKFIRLDQMWKFVLSIHLYVLKQFGSQPSQAFPYRLLCQFSGKILITCSWRWYRYVAS
ncbi:ADP-ribosylation factor GTPase-activating protein agd12 [Datura stramonium]|uniref:ADP-ribosylation factor GTPase-activating protein agd12 n=1 Tax=Datura stramonium TaxID=4076 RepID=A0ABS8V4E9_DATST|nr:ADP-ribosylation factor GTPase-activating protein agd12 [Datura stramonium]